MSENWRDRRLSQERGEAEYPSETGAETKLTSGSWRARRQEKEDGVKETGVYADSMPPEWKLQKMYKQLKIATNGFTTWLVESVYPCGEDLPFYITREQAKGEGKPDRVVTSTASLTMLANYAEYKIIVNNITEIARRIQQVPPDILALLDSAINQRSEYSHWMSRKSTDAFSKLANDKHVYFTEVLKDVKTILANRTALEKKTWCQPKAPNYATPANTPTRTSKPTLGKRKIITSSFPFRDEGMAIKTEPATSKLMHFLYKEVKQPTITQGQQHQQWRQVVAESYNNIAGGSSAFGAKPISYAATLHLPVTT